MPAHLRPAAQLGGEAACWAARKNKVDPAEIPFDVVPAFTQAVRRARADRCADNYATMCKRRRQAREKSTGLQRKMWLSEIISVSAEPTTSRRR